LHKKFGVLELQICWVTTWTTKKSSFNNS